MRKWGDDGGKSLKEGVKCLITLWLFIFHFLAEFCGKFMKMGSCCGGGELGNLVAEKMSKF